jgi:hypothetical protein
VHGALLLYFGWHYHPQEYPTEIFIATGAIVAFHIAYIRYALQNARS